MGCGEETTIDPITPGPKIITGAKLPDLATNQSEFHTVKSERKDTDGTDYQNVSTELVFYANDVLKGVSVSETKTDGEETKDEMEAWAYNRDGMLTMIEYLNGELQGQIRTFPDPEKYSYDSLIATMKESVVQATVDVAADVYHTFMLVGTEEGDVYFEEQGIDPADLVLKDMGKGVYRLETTATKDGVKEKQVAEVGLTRDGLITHFLLDIKRSEDDVETATRFLQDAIGRGIAPTYVGSFPELPA
jgi:hypothetical protein